MKKTHLLLASSGLAILLLGVVIFLLFDMYRYETSRDEIAEITNNIQSDINDVNSALESTEEEDDSAQIRTVNQDGVELKSEPNLNSETIRTFVSGENVFPTNFISYNGDEFWVQVVDRNGETGWLLEEKLR